MTKLDTFTQAYIECALWSSIDEQDRPMDENFSTSDIAPETLAEIVSECELFQEQNAELLSQWYEIAGESVDRAGHDFWLTRNRHGAGYWDRWSDSTPQGQIGRKLTDVAHSYGNSDLYVGDDGQIYAQ